MGVDEVGEGGVPRPGYFDIPTVSMGMVVGRLDEYSANGGECSYGWLPWEMRSAHCRALARE